MGLQNRQSFRAGGSCAQPVGILVVRAGDWMAEVARPNLAFGRCGSRIVPLMSFRMVIGKVEPAGPAVKVARPVDPAESRRIARVNAIHAG